MSKNKKGWMSLRDRLGNMPCPICGVPLAARMEDGYGVAQLPDGKIYCKICADTIRAAVYSEGEPPTWTM